MPLIIGDDPVTGRPIFDLSPASGAVSGNVEVNWGEPTDGKDEPAFAPATLIEYASSFMGVPYVWGGASPGGFDCSGFTQYVMKNFGVDLPHYSTSQFTMGTPVSKSELQVGDLVFFAGSLGTVSAPRHVGIYIGNGQFIQAGSGGVHISTLASYPGYAGARRYSGMTGQLGGGEGAYLPTAAGPTLGDKEAVNDIFIETLGRPATPSEMSRIINGQWSDDHIFRYITNLPEFLNSPGFDQMGATFQLIWNKKVGNTPVPEAELMNWIKNRWTTDQVIQRIESLPAYLYGTEYKTQALDWNELWETKTGIPLTYTAREKRDEMLRGGLSITQWEAWIETTDSYASGVEMDAKKQDVTDTLIDAWGWGVVNQKLLDDPDFVENVVWGELGEGAAWSVVQDWARRQPEWMAGPEAATSKRGLRELWGTIMRQPISDARLDQMVFDGITTDQLYEQMRQNPAYQAMYQYTPAWMSESEWHYHRDAYNAVGRWYFAPEQDYEMKWIARPEVAAQISGQAATQYMLSSGWKFEGGVWYEPSYPDVWRYEDAQIGFFIANGISEQELEERYRWTEDAIANLPTMNYLGQAIGRTYTQADAYLVASGAQGSGQIRADLIRAENLRQFDTVFAIYNDRAPSAADYRYLENNFISPQEYAVKMQAIEDADAMFPEIDEMFQRVYGYGADRNKLRLMAQNAKGSGAYKALVQAAEELDRYTSVWRLYAKTDPTPEQYAGWAGFAGPEELAKMLEVKELVDSQGEELLRTYSDYWVEQGLPGLAESDIETLLGKYEGWGEIDARMRIAQEHRDRQDTARLNNLSAGVASGWITVTEFGGSKAFSMRRVVG